MEPQIDFNAIQHGLFENIPAFLSQGGNVNVTNCEGNTLLHYAVLYENIEFVRILTEAQSDLSLVNNNGDTAMYLALTHRTSVAKVHMLKILVAAGADVNIRTRDQYGMTTLQVAATLGDAGLVQLLLSRGVDVNVTDTHRFRWTALHYAAANIRCDDPTIFEMLLTAGADIHALGIGGGTPLHVIGKFSPANSSPVCRIIKLLLDYGADFSKIDEIGCTPMDYAVRLSNTETVKALIIVAGINVNSHHVAFDDDSISTGKILLHGACYDAHIPTMKFLLENGANLNALDHNYRSPLQCTIDAINVVSAEDMEPWYKGIEALNYLFQWNPDVNTITVEGENILTSTEYVLPDILWQTILQHLAKLRANNCQIHLNLVNTILRKPEYHNYFETCLQELETARNTQLQPDCLDTFFHLLIYDSKQIIQCAGNIDLTKINLAQKFPIYGMFMEERFSNVMKAQKILDQIANEI